MSARARPVHPGAWWAWAVALAAATIRTTNPVLLFLLCGVAAYVVAARRPAAPWARSFASFARLGAVVVVFRVVLEALAGPRLPGHVILTLPSLELPGWAAGVSVGGPVTREAVAGAAYQGLRLATILLCIGGANSLASPYRLLRSLPAVVYEAGVAATVALAFAPEAVVTAGRVRQARRLRGRATRGPAGVRGLVVPVLEGALERSLALAASMDARGYGRRALVPERQRRVARGAVIAGVMAVCVGVYGLLDATSSTTLGWPLLALGSAAAAVGVTVAGRRSTRTRYRPDRWGGVEWVVAASGVATTAAFVVTGWLSPGDLAPSTQPLEVPGVPLLAVAGALVALLPAVATPAVAPDPSLSPAVVGPVGVGPVEVGPVEAAT